MSKMISFAHRFVKLPNDHTAKLIQVIQSDYSVLSDQFKRYDGRYIDPDPSKNQDGLPCWEFPESGQCLILIFESIYEDKIFTTVRDFSYENLNDYMASIGEVYFLDVIYK